MKPKGILVYCTALLFLTAPARAQHEVRLRINGRPSYDRRTEDMYLAGSFNDWNPAHAQYRFSAKKSPASFEELTLRLPAGHHEFKITRGGWNKVECGDNGFPAENHVLNLSSDTVITIQITNWSDHFPAPKKNNTAGKHVRIIDTAFYIPQLNRHRRIWIYLPESYASSKKRYPVLYMQDGQNVFDEATSGYGEWGIDEAVDTLGPRYGECMVVAIDHGGDTRMNEYSPFDMAKYGKGEGDRYADFLAKTLKPFIDKHYRTKKASKYNFIAGSSMGGLISFYSIFKYPSIFGAAGVFSPSFWIAPPFRQLDAARVRKLKGKIYFYAGGAEGESMVPDMMQVYGQLRGYGKVKMKTVIRAEGRHNEGAWRKEFPAFYRWLMEDL